MINMEIQDHVIKYYGDRKLKFYEPLEDDGQHFACSYVTKDGDTIHKFHGMCTDEDLANGSITIIRHLQWKLGAEPPED